MSKRWKRPKAGRRHRLEVEAAGPFVPARDLYLYAEYGICPVLWWMHHDVMPDVATCERCLDHEVGVCAGRAEGPVGAGCQRCMVLMGHPCGVSTHGPDGVERFRCPVGVEIMPDNGGEPCVNANRKHFSSNTDPPGGR